VSRWPISRAAFEARRRPVLQLYWSGAGLWSFERRGEAGRAWPDLTAFCSAHRGRRLRLWLGAAWVHSLVIPEDLPLTDEAALDRYARAQLTHYFGAAAQSWPLAGWHLGAQRGVCALQESEQGPSLAALREQLQSHRLQLLSVRPLWSRALEAASEHDAAWARGDRGALALLEGSQLSWLSVADGRLIDIQQRYLDRCEPAELQALLDELQPTGAPSPRLIGWRETTTQRTDTAWPDLITDGPQAAQWLCGV